MRRDSASCLIAAPSGKELGAGAGGGWAGGGGGGRGSSLSPGFSDMTPLSSGPGFWSWLSYHLAAALGASPCPSGPRFPHLYSKRELFSLPLASGKETARSSGTPGDVGFISGLGRSLGEGNGNPP